MCLNVLKGAALESSELLHLLRLNGVSAPYLLVFKVYVHAFMHACT